MTDKITLIIADDHSIIREGIIGLFEFEEDVEVIGEASNGLECIELVKKQSPDVLLLDISMPGLNGLEALKILRENDPYIKVIILSIHDELQYYKKSFELGAYGYVLKDSDFNTLNRAVHNVAHGEKFVDPKLSSLSLEEKRKCSILKDLTKRENEILLYIAKGYSNKDIAATLNVSEKTIKNHVSNLFKKLDVNDRTQAAIFALKNNIV